MTIITFLSFTFVCFQNFTRDEMKEQSRLLPVSYIQVENANLQNSNFITSENSETNLGSTISSWAEKEKNVFFEGRDAEILQNWGNKINQLISKNKTENNFNSISEK